MHCQEKRSQNLNWLPNDVGVASGVSAQQVAAYLCTCLSLGAKSGKRKHADCTRLLVTKISDTEWTQPCDKKTLSLFVCSCPSFPSTFLRILDWKFFFSFRWKVQDCLGCHTNASHTVTVIAPCCRRQCCQEAMQDKSHAPLHQTRDFNTCIKLPTSNFTWEPRGRGTIQWPTMTHMTASGCPSFQSHSYSLKFGAAMLGQRDRICAQPPTVYKLTNPRGRVFKPRGRVHKPVVGRVHTHTHCF